jgi:rhamnosyltransferase subunit B
MRILVVTLGSIGDLIPFLAVAEALRQRGHDVIVGSNAGYAALVQRAGFRFGVIWDGTPAPLDDALDEAPEQAWEQVRRDLFLPAMEPTAAFIRHFATRDCTVLAAWPAFGALSACAALQLSLTRVCLSPHAVQKAMAGPQTPLQKWLVFFPGWFCGPQPGWPHITLTDFPALEEALVPPLETAVEDFLRDGSPPVIFTPGSFQRNSSRFFRESLSACMQLGLRALFLTPYSGQVPANLPVEALHRNYAPLQRLAGRAAALVHHGGIGTLAQGLRSGVPQIAAPVFYDQFDNAARLERLDVGRMLPARDYRAATLTPLLDEIINDESIRRRCEETQLRFEGDPAETICTPITS